MTGMVALAAGKADAEGVDRLKALDGDPCPYSWFHPSELQSTTNHRHKALASRGVSWSLTVCQHDSGHDTKRAIQADSTRKWIRMLMVMERRRRVRILVERVRRFLELIAWSR